MKVLKLASTVLVTGLLVTGCGHMGGKQYTVYFDSGSSSLSPAAKSTLMKVAKEMKKEKEASIKWLPLSKKKIVSLSGHTDAVGSKDLNEKLAEKRIDAVEKQLMRYGVKDASIATNASGEWWQAISTKDGVSHSKNRRVDISVY
ncbi:OmpA family protein [Rickettsiales bacterium]|nr:OmpA family protein [Rickettsiales bacterium]